jgi:hypothetical protein
LRTLGVATRSLLECQEGCLESLGVQPLTTAELRKDITIRRVKSFDSQLQDPLGYGPNE